MPPNTISRVPLLKINLHSQFVKEKNIYQTVRITHRIASKTERDKIGISRKK